MKTSHGGRASSVGVVAVATLLAVAAVAYTRVNAQPPALTIARVTLSVDGTTLFIYGDQFGTAPAVIVGGMRAQDVVVDPNGTAITAAMPSSLAPGM